MNDKKIQTVVYMGVAAALCAAATFILIPGPNGALIHLGSAAIYTVAVVFGKRIGAVGGGIGSMLFDALVGFSGYTLFSLVIKGGAGYLVGHLTEKDKNPTRLRILFATVAASLWTLVGYIVAWRAVIGSWAAAFANTPFSLMTSALGIVVAVAAAPKLREIVQSRTQKRD